MTKISNSLEALADTVGLVTSMMGGVLLSNDTGVTLGLTGTFYGLYHQGKNFIMPEKKASLRDFALYTGVFWGVGGIIEGLEYVSGEKVLDLFEQILYE